MTTLATVTMRVARRTIGIKQGTATTGDTDFLTDVLGLQQQNNYWTKGTLWVLSGDNEGQLREVSSHLGNKITFTAFSKKIAAGVRYALAQRDVPYRQLVAGVVASLDDILVTGIDDTLEGDGETKGFELPPGVSSIWFVEVVDSDGTARIDSHYEEVGGYLNFLRTAPAVNTTLKLRFLHNHDELVDYDDEVSPEVNIEWLVWQSVVNVLRWCVKKYPKSPNNYEVFLNEALDKVKNLRPLSVVRVSIQTA
jgi:hypothetical protein